MIKDCIDYFNVKLTTLDYFNKVLCLAEKIERKGQSYPAIYTANGEYKQINLDTYGTVSYWRKNGDVSISEQTNATLSKGVQYETTIPLKLICFLKRDVYANDQYFADTLCQEIIGYLTTNNSALKAEMKAKKVSLIGKSYKTDSREVGLGEYDNIEFEARYTYVYFSIDFDLKIISNNNCYNNIC